MIKCQILKLFFLEQKIKKKIQYFRDLERTLMNRIFLISTISISNILKWISLKYEKIEF